MHPALVRHFLSPLLEWALGRDTHVRYADLARAQFATSAEVHERQGRRLFELLEHAGQRCRYYRQLFDRTQNFTIAGDPFQALARLPLLSRDTVRQHLHDMTDWSVEGGPLRCSTGGSTGAPLQFHLDRGRIAADKAARMLTHAWMGALPGDREAYLWGAPIELRGQDFLRHVRDRVTNEMLLSAFDLTPVTMRAYLRKLRGFRPAALFGYPSSLVKLVEFAESERLAAPRDGLRAVFTTGERLESRQRAVLARYFDVPVADGYGSRDGGLIAHECSAGIMHIIEPHVVVEIVDADGEVLPDGEIGEIVVTHLENRAMPLLRYRTGDRGAVDSGLCACGRSWRRLREIDGRQSDHLIAGDGALQHGLSAIYVVRELANVRAFQVRQRMDRSVDVAVVPTETYGDGDTQKIVEGLQERLGRSLPVRVRLVQNIPVSASGKYRHVISEAAERVESGCSGVAGG
jgi:phenylacetate-CoA ligase